MKTAIRHVLWDLDGTLTDPKEGIIRCIQYALREAGRPIPHRDEELHGCIGPPLQHSFSKLIPQASEDEIWQLVEKYRERFSSSGFLENRVYSGIVALLQRLNHLTHYVATSKPHVFARRIVSHFDLSHHFTRVYGSEMNGERSDKGELITHVLKSENIESAQAAMIGDRQHDVIGARKAGLVSIGITWGYGSREELEEAGADYIFSDPESLGEFLSR